MAEKEEWEMLKMTLLVDFYKGELIKIRRCGGICCYKEGFVWLVIKVFLYIV